MTNFQRIDILETIKKVNRQGYAIATTFVGKHGNHKIEVISELDNWITVYLEEWDAETQSFSSEVVFNMAVNSPIGEVTKLLDIIEEKVAEADA